MSILGDLWVPITSHCSRKRPAQSLNLLHRPNRHLLKSRSSNRVVIKAQNPKKTRPKWMILSRPFKRIWKWKVTQVIKLKIIKHLIFPNFLSYVAVEDHFAKALGDTWVKLQKAEEEKRSSAKKSDQTETKKPTLVKASS